MTLEATATLAVLLTPKEVAEYLGTTTAALSQLRYLSRGPRYVKAGRNIRYRLSDIEDYINSNVRETGQVA